MERGHAAALMPMVGAVMAEAGCGFGDLDAVAVTIGPGTFTGLRIGLATARGLALAANLPVLGVTTLEAVANGVPPERIGGANLLVALDTKRADIYLQPFSRDLAPLASPAALMPTAIGAALAKNVPSGRLGLVGAAAAPALAALAGNRSYRAAVLDAPPLPDAAVVARLAAARFGSESRPGAGSARPTPLYLRPPAASPPHSGPGHGVTGG